MNNEEEKAGKQYIIAREWWSRYRRRTAFSCISHLTNETIIQINSALLGWSVDWNLSSLFMPSFGCLFQLLPRCLQTITFATYMRSYLLLPRHALLTPSQYTYHAVTTNISGLIPGLSNWPRILSLRARIKLKCWLSAVDVALTPAEQVLIAVPGRKSYSNYGSRTDGSRYILRQIFPRYRLSRSWYTWS